MKPKPTTVRFDRNLLASLEGMASQLDMKRAELIRLCVRLGLAQVVRDHMLMRAAQSPATTTGPSIGALNVVALPAAVGEGAP